MATVEKTAPQIRQRAESCPRTDGKLKSIEALYRVREISICPPAPVPPEGEGRCDRREPLSRERDGAPSIAATVSVRLAVPERVERPAAVCRGARQPRFAHVDRRPVLLRRRESVLLGILGEYVNAIHSRCGNGRSSSRFQGGAPPGYRSEPYMMRFLVELLNRPILQRGATHRTDRDLDHARKSGTRPSNQVTRSCTIVISSRYSPG